LRKGDIGLMDIGLGLLDRLSSSLKCKHNYADCNNLMKLSGFPPIKSLQKPIVILKFRFGVMVGAGEFLAPKE